MGTRETKDNKGGIGNFGLLHETHALAVRKGDLLPRDVDASSSDAPGLYQWQVLYQGPFALVFIELLRRRGQRHVGIVDPLDRCVCCCLAMIRSP